MTRQGKQVYTGTLPLNDYGTFNFDFALDQEAALGGYSIQAQIPVRVSGTGNAATSSITTARSLCRNIGGRNFK